MARVLPGQAGGIAGLHRFLSRYGARVEADFQQFYALDPFRMLVNGEWRRLWLLILQLPGDSRVVAIADDIRKTAVVEAGMARRRAAGKDSTWLSR